MGLLSVTLVLFLIMDPFGNIASLLNIFKEVDPKKERLIVLREMGFALIAMIAFNYLGEYIFNILGLSEPSLILASGLILFLVALQILFPTLNSLRNTLPSGEPYIVPIAIPLIAGPSLLATIMLYARLEESEPLMLKGILISWLAASAILLLARPIHRILGKNGLNACERLMGMVLVMLAVQRLTEGVEKFVSECLK